MLERLQKIISRAGIASRRHAEDLIRSGQVRVNGAVVTELGAKADPERDRVEAAGRVARIAPERTYLALHKPPQVVSTLADPEGRPTLTNVLTGVGQRVYPVGRLDYAASGLIFLTDDGDLANRLLKALPRLAQTFWVKIKGRLSEDEMRAIAAGARAKLRPLRAPHSAGSRGKNLWYEAEMAEASRDLLRRKLFDAEHPVEKLKRVKIGPLDLEGLIEGRYRRLDSHEVARLVRAIDRALSPRGSAAGPLARRAAPRRRRVRRG